MNPRCDSSKWAARCRTILSDQRGDNLIAFALLVGFVALVAASAVSNYSNSLKEALTYQSDKLAVSAGAPVTSSGGGSGSTAGSGGSGSGGSTASSGSGSSSSSGGASSSGSSSGSSANGNGKGNSGNGKGNGGSNGKNAK